MDIRHEPVPYQTWGEENIEPSARDQMQRAAQLPVAVQGALMPDAHTGYGLPIGGVLATRNALIPYAVGVDIACRMRLTVFNISPHVLGQKRDKFRKVLENNTSFGMGSKAIAEVEHPVLDDPTWTADRIISQYKDIAWQQIGSSGGGNHFVEFGSLTVNDPITGDGLLQGEGSRAFGHIPAGTYLALLSHSGSRRFGLEMAEHFTQLAMAQHPELPKAYIHLAWLDMDTHAGQLYWQAMNLAGRYASANHAVIHQHIIDDLRYEVLGGVENHHNFAWQETMPDGEQVYVHRKGATPAGAGVYGVIPGSMTEPGFVVRGKGNPAALNSAAHGAGRRMSRQSALKRFEWREVNEQLKRAGVELLSAGLDETPGAYKDMRYVMAAQTDLVEAVGEFKPLMVKMAPDERTQRQERRAMEREKSDGKRQRRK